MMRMWRFYFSVRNTHERLLEHSCSSVTFAQGLDAVVQSFKKI